MTDKKKKATDIEWLRYFFDNADFGPAHEDVVSILVDSFESDTGKLVPSKYDYRKY